MFVRIIVTKQGTLSAKNELDKLSVVAILHTRSLKHKDVKVAKSIHIQNVCPHQQHGLLTHTNSDASRTFISASR